MSSRTLRLLLAVTAVGTVGAASVAPAASADTGPTGRDGRSAVGLAGDALVRFDTARPDRVTRIGPITGLEQADTTVVGIDRRVQDGELYAVGRGGGLYTVDDRAAATKIGQLSVALDGASFGVDFNPAANALRIVSDTGQNLRQPFAATPLAATVEDTPLTNPATPPATGTVAARGVTAAAYTNNDADDATSTTLFVLDTVLDRVAVQSPANGGTLAPTGKLPVDIGPDSGLDIGGTTSHGRTTADRAYAVVDRDGTPRLWTVDLLSGAATSPGTLAAPVTDIAVALDEPRE